MSKFTDARLAVWKAIDNWPALNPGGRSVFNRKIRHDSNTANLENDVQAGMSDLLAIEVVPTTASPNWFTNRMQECNYFLGCKVVGHILTRVEDVIESVWEAIYQAKEGSSELSYVRAATGYHPLSFGATWTRTKSSGVTVWQATLAIGLRFQKDPLGREP